MKKFIIRLVIALLLIPLYFVVNRIMNNLEIEYSKPVTLRFELPMQDSIIRKYGLNDPIEVEKVILAGNFSDWDKYSDAYELTQISDTEWEITLILHGGDNPYKFVVYLSNPENHDLPDWSKDGIIWVEDKNAEKYEDDSFGGLNSVYTVKSTGNFRIIFSLIVVIIGSGLIGYSILEIAVKQLMKAKMSLKLKLIIIFLVFMLIFNVVFVLSNISSSREFLKIAQSDQLNLIHSVLLSEGIEFDNLSDESNRLKIQSRLDALFNEFSIRESYKNFSNIKVHINTL